MAAWSGDEEALCRRGVMLLSFGFLGVFGGFQAAQGLQSSLTGPTLGELNLAVLYGTFALLCLVAPPLLSRLERCLGMRILLLLCAVAYAAMALSNVLKMPTEASPIWAVPIACNFLVGVAAPLLWTSQNIYVSRCATRAATALAARQGGHHWMSQMTTRYNSLFFSVYQFAGMSGTTLASVILLALAGGEDAKSALFVTLSLLSMMGALVFLALPDMPDSEADENSYPSLWDTGMLALSDAKVGLMIPLMLTNGMTLAFWLGDFQADVTCPVAGPSFTGFVMAVFYGVNSVMSFSWGQFISRSWMSRRLVYIVASVLLAVFLLMKLIWHVPQNYVLPPDSTEWQRSRSPSTRDVCVIFLMAALFAVADSFFESGPPMTLQTFFSGTDKVVPAMANYKLWQSIGFAVQFWLSIVLKKAPLLRGGVLLVMLGISFVCMLLLDLRVAKLDDRASDVRLLVS